MSLENSLILGRYRVLWPLESRKLIRSYIARDERREGLGSPVLVKQYLHDLGDKGSARRAALFDELSRLTELRHPGVVSLLDFGSVEHGLVTVHAHQQGVYLPLLCDVFAKKQEQFPPELAVFVARGLLDILQQCHTRSAGALVHGRLTLGCIYLPTSGEPQIADFGLAALEDVAADAEMQLGFFQTRMSYSAPELTRGASASAQGDTYSVALLLYRLLAGSNPFRGRSIPETLQRVLQLAPAELLMPAWEGVARANSVLMRALDKDPARRFQSCQELSEALRPLELRSAGSLRDELSALVRQQAACDWAQLTRLTRSVGGSSMPSQVRDELHPHPAPLESQAPAFVSGLITEQPRSVSEHSNKARRDSRERRERRRQLMVLPTVLIPAVAVMVGLFLGRLGGAGANAAAGRELRQTADAPPLVTAMVDVLRTRLRDCGNDPQLGPGPQVELEFGAAGALTGVRLNPPQLSHSRLGACLLETAWRAELRAPGPMTVKIPLETR